jgi:hypothetical protein
MQKSYRSNRLEPHSLIRLEFKTVSFIPQPVSDSLSIVFARVSFIHTAVETDAIPESESEEYPKLELQVIDDGEKPPFYPDVQIGSFALISSDATMNQTMSTSSHPATFFCVLYSSIRSVKHRSDSKFPFVIQIMFANPNFHTSAFRGRCPRHYCSTNTHCPIPRANRRQSVILRMNCGTNFGFRTADGDMDSL